MVSGGHSDNLPLSFEAAWFLADKPRFNKGIMKWRAAKGDSRNKEQYMYKPRFEKDRTNMPECSQKSNLFLGFFGTTWGLTKSKNIC